jgi:hypothetical protein
MGGMPHDVPETCEQKRVRLDALFAAFDEFAAAASAREASRQDVLATPENYGGVTIAPGHARWPEGSHYSWWARRERNLGTARHNFQVQSAAYHAEAVTLLAEIDAECG